MAIHIYECIQTIWGKKFIYSFQRKNCDTFRNCSELTDNKSMTNMKQRQKTKGYLPKNYEEAPYG